MVSYRYAGHFNRPADSTVLELFRLLIRVFRAPAQSEYDDNDGGTDAVQTFSSSLFDDGYTVFVVLGRSTDGRHTILQYGTKYDAPYRCATHVNTSTTQPRNAT